MRRTRWDGSSRKPPAGSVRGYAHAVKARLRVVQTGEVAHLEDFSVPVTGSPRSLHEPPGGCRSTQSGNCGPPYWGRSARNACQPHRWRWRWRMPGDSPGRWDGCRPKFIEIRETIAITVCRGGLGQIGESFVFPQSAGRQAMIAILRGQAARRWSFSRPAQDQGDVVIDAVDSLA